MLAQQKLTTSLSKYYDEPISPIVPLMFFTDISDK